MHAESSCELETVPLEVVGPKVGRDAFFADGLSEDTYGLAAALKRPRTDLAGFLFVFLPTEEAVADILDRQTGVR